MKRLSFTRNIAAYLLVWAILVTPIAVLGQTTKIELPKNKYKIEDDIKIGEEYSAKVEQEMPIISNAQASAYLAQVGERLVAAIPEQFQNSRYKFRFKIVNASDINAFALPGGPMYVNRGLIQVANNEGEMAGVMAHEISHVVLRHGTAQATRQSGLTQVGLIGATIFGGILGGQAGAQLGAALFAGSFILKYSREYETNSDILGAQIMARAGYDPLDLANMFKTIAAQNKGGGSPEWLSSHPDPQRRYDTIMRERNLLRLAQNLTKITQGFQNTRGYLASLAPPKSMTQIEKQGQTPQTGQTSPTGQNEQTGNSQMSQGQYSRNVPAPSIKYQIYRGSDLFSMSVPTNWKQFPNANDIFFSPEGAYGNDGITHGAMVGIANVGQDSLENSAKAYVDGLLRSNAYLKQSTNFTRVNISGRRGYATRLSGVSPVTSATENVDLYMTQLQDGSLFYFVGVAPASDSMRYNPTFNNVVRSIRINANY